MPKKIKLSGVVVGDENAWIYDWLGIPYISPSLVDNALEEANGEDVEVYVNSGGGSTWTGSEIYTSLKEYSGFVTAKIPSIAGSAASVFIMGADKVLISPTAQIFIHRSMTRTEGNEEVHQQSAQMLSSVDEGMINAYVAKTGRTREEILNLMKNETFFDAKRAVELGFADEIMFAAEELSPVASMQFGIELPPEVLDTVRSKILTASLGKQDIENLDQGPVAKKPVEPTKEEPKTMDFKELQAKHPDLVQEIMGAATQEAIKAERKRIADLNALATAPGAAQFITDAIANGETAAEVAMKIVQASAERVKAEGKDRLEDSQDSNVTEVVAQAPAVPGQKDEEDEEKSVNAMVEFAKELIAKKGGLV